MKKLHILVILLLLTVGIQACGSSGDRPERDIYRVEVRTHLNIRDSPSRRGNVIGYINNGELIEVIDVRDGWASIEFGQDGVGYVSSDYLSLVRKYNNDAETSEPVQAELADDNTSQTPSSQESPKTPDESPVIPKGGNVYFIGDSTILSDYDKTRISDALKTADKYVFIVNTVDNVPVGSLFDYAPDLLDSLSEELDSSMNWWQRFKSWFGGDSPSSNIVLISYVKSAFLLQAECNGNSLKYLKMSRPKDYFRLQEAVSEGLPSAIAAMGLAIDSAGAEYETRSWFVRVQINTGNILENICEDWIVENILPRDSFWHKWVLGWLFALPLKFANWLFVLTGSYLMTLVTLMIVILGLYIFSTFFMFKVQRIGAEKTGCLGTSSALLTMIVNAFLWLSMLSMLIYMIPDMATLSVMSQTGYSADVVRTALHSFENHAVSKNWFLVTMFLVGLFLSLGLNAGYALNATLPSRIQKRIFANNKDDIEKKKMFEGESLDDKLLNSDHPYTDLFMESMGKDNVGQALGTSIPLSFVFNGSFLLFASLFFWTKVLKRLITIALGVMSYRKQGLY